MRDPRPPLREADAAFQSTPLPPQALARLRRRVFDEPRGKPVRWIAAAGLAVAVLLAVAYAALRPQPQVEDVQLATGERFATADVQLAALAPSLIHRDHAVLTLRSGQVLVTVEPRPATAPVRLVVSHGAVEAVAARFTLRQGAEGGSVEVHDGRVRFLSEQVTAEVVAGESLTWPAPLAAPSPAPTEEAHAVPEPSPEPQPEPAPAPKRPKARVARPEPAVIRETDAAWLLEEVDLLRSRGEYGEAVRLLDKGIAGLVSAKTRERFSFELGSILTYQRGDAPRACRHWATHEASFPGGRYAQEVRSAKEKARCDAH